MLISVIMCSIMSIIILENLSYITSFSVMVFFMVFYMSVSNMSLFSCGGLVYYDYMSVSLMILSCYICLMSFIASKNMMRMNKFTMLMVMLFITLMLAFSVSNFFLFFFVFESVLSILVIIVLGWGVQPERLQACTYLFIYTVFGSLFFLLGISMLYMEGFCPTMNSLLSLTNKSKSSFWWVFLLGFLIKMPMYPFHLWLPKAHVEAPVSGSMLLAGVVLKLGGYGMLRLFSFFEYNSTSWFYSFILALCMLGGVYSSFVCVRQVDMKCLVAYSSVSHMSLVVLGVMSNAYIGLMGAMVIMIGHGLCSSGMFAWVTKMYDSSGSRSMIMNKGYTFISPLLVLLGFLVSSSNMAAPPSLNLVGEVMIFMVCSSVSSLFFIFLSVMSFMSAFYSLFLYLSCCHGKPSHWVKKGNCFQYSDFICLALHWMPLNLLIMLMI